MSSRSQATPAAVGGKSYLVEPSFNHRLIAMTTSTFPTRASVLKNSLQYGWLSWCGVTREASIFEVRRGCPPKLGDDTGPLLRQHRANFRGEPSKATAALHAIDIVLRDRLAPRRAEICWRGDFPTSSRTPALPGSCRRVRGSRREVRGCRGRSDRRRARHSRPRGRSPDIAR
jgi:hypothetical protein